MVQAAAVPAHLLFSPGSKAVATRLGSVNDQRTLTPGRAAHGAERVHYSREGGVVAVCPLIHPIRYDRSCPTAFDSQCVRQRRCGHSQMHGDAFRRDHGPERWEKALALCLGAVMAVPVISAQSRDVASSPGEPGATSCTAASPRYPRPRQHSGSALTTNLQNVRGAPILAAVLGEQLAWHRKEGRYVAHSWSVRLFQHH